MRSSQQPTQFTEFNSKRMFNTLKIASIACLAMDAML